MLKFCYFAHKYAATPYLVRKTAPRVVLATPSVPERYTKTQSRTALKLIHPFSN